MKRKRVASKAEPKSLQFVETLKRQWMATVDAVPDPLMSISADYKIIKANKALATLSGKSIKDVLGKKCFDIFADRKTPCEGCHLKSEMAGERIRPYELETMRDSQPKFFEVSPQVMEDPATQEKFSLHVYRDVTTAKLLQEQLIQSEKLASIGTLAGGFAHEINNPLGGILVFSQMALREMDKKHEQYKDLEEIEKAAQRCKKIVDDLLAFARKSPRSKRQNDTDLHEAIKSALEFTKVGFKSGKWYIHAELNAARSTVLADQQRVVQIFLNLFKNALQAMPKGGDLEIVSSNERVGGHDMIKVLVRDTGVGIPKNMLSKIFDPFFTTKQPGEGTGLGLSIVYGIVRECNGTIKVNSTPKKGTDFILHFPVK